METLQDRIRWPLIGCIGLIGITGFVVFLFLNLATIMFTPRSTGNGDYYDTGQSTGDEANWAGMLIVLAPLLMMFYPWLKLFVSKIFHYPRKRYFGLFLASNIFFKIVSIALLVINLLTIIWLTIESTKEANHIANRDYTYALCPDNSMYYLSHLFGIFVFWSIINIAYGVFNHFANVRTFQNGRL